MKKFIRKCLLMVLLILLSIGVANFLYTRTEHWKSLSETSKFNAVPDHIEIANIGSSHGVNSFDYRHVPYRTFNFALAAQFFPYDYGILKKYIDCFDTNAVLFIPVAYYEITNKTAESPGKKRDKRDINNFLLKARYYRFLDKQYIVDYSLIEKAHTLFIDFFTVLTVDGALVQVIKDSPLDPFFSDKSMTDEQLIDYCNKRYTEWTGKTGGETDAEEDVFSYDAYWISRIIELCYARNIQPILVSTPIVSILNNIYLERSPGFFDVFYRFIRELQETYPYVRYFDYSHDQRFENNFPLFRDGDHLNSLGADKFTAIVMDDLKASGGIFK